MTIQQILTVILCIILALIVYVVGYGRGYKEGVIEHQAFIMQAIARFSEGMKKAKQGMMNKDKSE